MFLCGKVRLQKYSETLSTFMMVRFVCGIYRWFKFKPAFRHRSSQVGAKPAWFSDGGRSERGESGGGVGGFEGGCISPLGLLTCRGLHLFDNCLLLFLRGFRGRLFLSSLASGWTRSLRVSEDSSMYARFSPKKSSSWQLAEAAMLRGAEGRSMERHEEGVKKLKEELWSKSLADRCPELLLDSELFSFSGNDLLFSCIVDTSEAPPSSMLLTVGQGCNIWRPQMEEVMEEASDFESKGDSDPDRDPLCKAAPAESSSEADLGAGRENERASM